MTMREAAAAAGVLLALCVASCASLNDGTIQMIEDEPARRTPVIEVTAAREGAPGATCGVQPELARGSPPMDARIIVELEMTSAVPEDTRAFEETARLHALQRCAAGISVLRAVAEGRGYTSVIVVLWDRALLQWGRPPRLPMMARVDSGQPGSGQSLHAR